MLFLIRRNSLYQFRKIHADIFQVLDLWYAVLRPSQTRTYLSLLGAPNLVRGADVQSDNEKEKCSE